MNDQGIWGLFASFNKKYFWGQLDKVRLSWSPHMTLCAGKTAYRAKGHSYSSCSIRLSQPLLSQRPRSDTVNTLLHEMIHAYLHVTQGLNYRDSHGPEFRKHMKRINDLEGSRVTVYHNFRREVDKFRIHVYRCDGPCTARRPYFGILRRAVTRPPGPGDKWWARHKQECGGTFHKIEGPGAVPHASSKADKMTKPSIHPKVSSSLYSPDNKYLTSDRNKAHINKFTGPHCKETHSKRRSRKFTQQSVSSGIRENFNEDQILRRIKMKYSNSKRSILLSKGETKNLLAVHQENRWKRGKSPEVGTLVDGNVNYNYVPKSTNKLNLRKYLNRYREVKNMKIHVPHQPRTFSVKSKSEVSRVIEKYMNRYHETKKNLHLHSSKPNLVAQNSSPSGIPEGTLSESFWKESQDQCLNQSSSSSSSCPICNTQIPSAEFDQHLQSCFGDDLDLEMDESFTEEEKNSSKDHTVKLITEVSGEVGNDWDQLEAKHCPHCGSLVLAEEMNLHLEYCSNSEDEDIESFSESSGKDHGELPYLLHKTADDVTCPSCMEKVKENYIQEHLNECLTLLSEEL